MPHIYSLAYLTSAPMAPPEALRLAAKLGYQAIGARIAPSVPGGDYSPLTTDAAMLRDTLRRIVARRQDVILRVKPENHVDSRCRGRHRADDSEQREN